MTSTAALAQIRSSLATLSTADLVAQVSALEADARTDAATRMVYAVAAATAARRLGVSARDAATSPLGAAAYLDLVLATR